MKNRKNLKKNADEGKIKEIISKIYAQGGLINVPVVAGLPRVRY